MSNNTGDVLHMLERSAAALDALREQAAEIATLADTITAALRDGGRLFLCGNGGSASQCQHAAAELTGRFQMERRGLAAVALTTDTSAITSIGNDYGFEAIFARQVEALARPGDVLLGLSTSGGSKNVVRAFERARELGVGTIALVGPTGGALAHLADATLSAPGETTAVVQESHLAVLHIICAIVERELAN